MGWISTANLTSDEIYFTLLGNAGEQLSRSTRYGLSIVRKVLCPIGRVETLLGGREQGTFMLNQSTVIQIPGSR